MKLKNIFGRQREAASILFIGAMPPPVNGASVMNRLYVEHLRSRGYEVIEFDTFGFSRTLNGVIYHISRAARCASIVFLLIISVFKLPPQWYLSISGGYGIIFDLSYVLIGRWLGFSIVFHHHSYRYLKQRSFLFSMLTRLAANDKNKHIFLSDKMRNSACKLYPAIECKNSFVVSNVGIYFEYLKKEYTRATPISRPKSKVGFLSNITKEKGGYRFLELLDKCEQDGLTVEFIMAGPCNDPKLNKRIKSEERSAKPFKYIGPVYARDKAQFYREIDIFVFPTLHVDEAEPLVLIEAAFFGCEILSYDVGSISDMGVYLELSLVAPGYPLDTELGNLVNRRTTIQASEWRDKMEKVSQRNIREFNSILLRGA